MRGRFERRINAPTDKISMTQTLTIKRPDDWHVHFREGAMLNLVAPYTARVFNRAIAMPNLRSPLLDGKACQAYKKQLVAAGGGHRFTPLPVLYLSDESDAETIRAAHPQVIAAKFYPRGATTGSLQGVSSYRKILDALAAMEKVGMLLLVHGEATEEDVDVYDREKVFIERTLTPVRNHFPELKIVFEHISSRDAIAFVAETSRTAATITPHHLLYNRSDLFGGGLRPHRYCLPVAKREEDRAALEKAATGGQAHFFAGTDSAPHQQADKCKDYGCAGIFNAVAALETYTEVFERLNALRKLENFTSVYGARFYGLETNQETITLKRRAWRVPEKIEGLGLRITPFRAGETIDWQVIDKNAGNGND